MNLIATEATAAGAPPTDPPGHRPAHVVIKAGRGGVALELGEVWRFRDLLSALAMRDLRLRYKQTILGATWVVLQPLMAAGIFTLVFGVVAKLPSEGLPYFVFSYAGLLGWNLFSATLTRVSGCLLGNSHLISKVYFPRLILPFSTLPGVLIDFAVAAVLMAVLMAVYGIAPTWATLLLPVWLAMLAAIAVGAGLVATSLAVSYRDVGYILPVLTQVLLYASPIAYALSAVPERVRIWYTINPLTGALEGLRWSLLGTAAPTTLNIGISLAAAVLAMAAGVVCFKTMERKFADVI